MTSIFLLFVLITSCLAAYPEYNTCYALTAWSEAGEGTIGWGKRRRWDTYRLMLKKELPSVHGATKLTNAQGKSGKVFPWDAVHVETKFFGTEKMYSWGRQQSYVNPAPQTESEVFVLKPSHLEDHWLIRRKQDGLHITFQHDTMTSAYSPDRDALFSYEPIEEAYCSDKAYLPDPSKFALYYQQIGSGHSVKRGRNDADVKTCI